MSLPHPLLKKIKEGRVALFFGSGALFGATLPDEKNILLGNDLRDLLCDTFLDGDFKDDQLSYVAGMAISAYSLTEIQTFIADYFKGIKPAPFHLKLPDYKWRAIFSTNYDRLVESIYSKTSSRNQNLLTFISDEQELDAAQMSDKDLPLVKLHGCITRTSDEELPLILTVDQYNDYKKNREQLFKFLYETAYQTSIVFVGHSLQDSNIRSILLDIQKEAPNGERHYLLKPNVKDLEIDHWAQKKITALDYTLEDFVSALDREIDEKERLLPFALKTGNHPIQRKFNSHKKPSDELAQSLERELTFLHNAIPVEPCDAKSFFKGVDQSWAAVAESIPITRNLQRKVEEFIYERSESERDVTTEFIVVKGEAGSGKTTLLRQLAWNGMESNIGVPIWVNHGKPVDADLVEEICHKSNERVYIFWDDPAIHSSDINKFMTQARKKQLKVSVVTAERFNEWNMRCDELNDLVTEKFELHYLSRGEVEHLVEALEKYDSLGPNLKRKNREEQIKELEEKHGRQLLVALHEATMGEPFADIIVNEFENVFPEQARKIYQTVCVLNRLRVPVRAGLISRIHEITFDDFKEKFYSPLEKVVISKGTNDFDFNYTARHPEIAEIVFTRVLTDNSERYQEYIGILNKLNISFSSDRESYRQLIKAKSLQSLFPDHDDIVAIYQHASKVFEDDAYLLQQMANYERIRSNGSLKSSIELLDRAKDIAPYDSSILHSLAICWRDYSKEIDSKVEKEKARNEARGFLRQIVSKWGDSTYVSSTFIELSILHLKDLLEDDDSSTTLVNDSIKNIQHLLSEVKQKFPGVGHVYKLEEEFSRLINDSEKALKALERAFEENDKEPYLAIRLSSIYLENGDQDTAEKVLKEALARRGSDLGLNYHYAELLRVHRNNTEESELSYYYRRAFSPKDRNFFAQFWFARFNFFSKETKDHQRAVDIFNHIRNSRVSFEAKTKIRDYDGSDDNPRRHNGTLIKKRESFGFVSLDGFGYEIFVPRNQASELWDAMKEEDRISFLIGFTLGGPVVDIVEPI